jgi:RNA polymerase sigma factor (sigma-70 family)
VDDAGAAEPADAELLNAWRAGDRAQGNVLFRRHVGSISRFFRTKLPESAEDLTQTTFLALVESEAPYRGEGSFRAYLYGIARNQLLMHLRGRARFQKRFDPLTDSAVDGGASPARLAARHEQQRLVMAALQRLPVDYQVALELHYFEGLALQDIARVLEQPLGTVKSHLSRGRTLLGERLQELAPPEELLTSALGELERWVASLPELVDGQGPESR